MHVVSESIYTSLLKSRARVECKKVGRAHVTQYNRIIEIRCVVDALSETICTSLLKSRALVECKKVGRDYVASQSRSIEIQCVVDARCR